MILNKTLIQRLVPAGLALLLWGAALPAQATALILRPAAGGDVVRAGDIISYDLWIDDVSLLYAYQFSLSFDPAVVRGLSVTEGPALPGAGSTFFVGGAFDAVDGRLDLTGAALVGSGLSFSGSGLLATLSFMGLDPGVSELRLGDVMLLNPDLDVLDTRITSGTVQVLPGSVPEPASASLVLSAALLAWRGRRPGRPAVVGA